jgi:hypothetical protein
MFKKFDVIGSNSRYGRFVTEIVLNVNHILSVRMDRDGVVYTNDDWVRV